MKRVDTRDESAWLLRLKLNYDQLHSNFGFKFLLVPLHHGDPIGGNSCGEVRGLHSSTFQLNLGRFCHARRPTYHFNQ